MKLFIDADGCPVVDEAVLLAKKYNTECFIICDTSHIINKDGAKTVTVDTAADSADFKLVNMLCEGDIAITGDYGLAAMCLSKKAIALNHNGEIYNDENINKLLFTRYLGKKQRNSGKHIKGPKKRTEHMDKSFFDSLDKLLCVYSYLNNRYLDNAGMIEALRRNEAYIVKYCKDGVLTYHKLSKNYFLSCDREETVHAFLDGLELDYLVLCNEKMFDCARRVLNVNGYCRARQYVYLKKDRLPINSEIYFRSPSDDEIKSIIMKQYHLEDEETLREINRRGLLWLFFDGENNIGFIGVHLDGSIGMLEIFPEYRKKGYGTLLESFAINKALDKGMLPFCHVVIGNEKSNSLQSKLSLTPSSGTVYWLYNED